ncbi:MAG: type II secretion system protein GspL [Pseudomonadota bacterium]
MREAAVIRLQQGRLVWYPAGAVEQALALDEPEQREHLEAQVQSRRAPMVFAAPGGDVTLREISISAAERRHIAKSLPFLLEDEFAGDIEDLHFASRPLGKLTLGVAACTHDAIHRWQQLLGDLPMAGQWVPEPLLLPWQPGELCLVIEQDKVVVRSGENEGFTAERDLCAAMLAALPEACAETVVAYGDDQGVDSALLPAWMQQRLQWRNGGFAQALMLSDEERQPLNLRQGAYGANLPVADWWRQWRRVAAVLAVGFVLQLAGSYASYASLAAENLELRRQIEAAYRDVAPRGAVVDAEKQLKQKLQNLRGGAETVSFVGMIDQIGRVVAAQPGAQLASVNFNDKLGDVRLNVIVPDFRAVESIRTGLVNAGLTAVTENSNASGNAVRARLKVGKP